MIRFRDASAILAIAFVVASAVSTAAAASHVLTFEERVAAQEAIERVYYSHQIGATRSFEEAVPREVMERKVRTYLKQSVAAERIWKMPITAGMLHAELERIARHTRFPERLQEIYAALRQDPFLLEECLARATLAERLTRDLFAFDGSLHVASRAEAEALRGGLERGDVDGEIADPRRTVVTIRRMTGGAAMEADAPGSSWTGPHDGFLATTLTPEEFDRVRSRAPREVGAVGGVMESRDSFTVSAVLRETPTSAQIATYHVRKGTYASWWEDVEHDFDESIVLPVARPRGGPPLPSGENRPSPALETTLTGLCPSDDVWEIGSLDGFLSGRSLHTAVWTGSRMIVWGGFGGSHLGTGGSYDPITDAWTETSTLGAPAARSGHTAVWDGNEMIVWGGFNGAYLQSGGRYDPLEDEWTATSSVGAPSGRSGHTAVWTGSEMIVWGGSVNTGGRYDPIADT